MIARDGGGVTTVCVDDTKTGSVKNDSEGWGWGDDGLCRRH